MIAISYEKGRKLKEEREKRPSNRDERRWSVRKKVATLIFRMRNGVEKMVHNGKACVRQLCDVFG